MVWVVGGRCGRGDRCGGVVSVLEWRYLFFIIRVILHNKKREEREERKKR